MSAAGRHPPGAAGATSRPRVWDEALAFGLGVLRLSPRDFWAMTPRELAAAAQGAAAPLHHGLTGAPSADDLAALMRTFPDST